MRNLWLAATLAGMWLPRPNPYFRRHPGRFAFLVIALVVLFALALGVAPVLALYSPPSWTSLIFAAFSLIAGIATIWWW